MSTQIQIFKSLNCSICDSPFSKEADNPKSPYRLACANGGVCRECWEREKPLSKKERRHQCNVQYDCFWNQRPAFFLIEILQNEAVSLSTVDGGYILKKEFSVSECPVCDEEYSLKNHERRPRPLACNHVICEGCFMKIKTPFIDPIHPEHQYEVICPICNEKRKALQIAIKSAYSVFLRELPQMTAQMRLMDRRYCLDCRKKAPLEELLFCIDCSKTICLRCAFNSHRVHKTEDFIKQEIRRISNDCEKNIMRNIDTYDQILIDLHNDIRNGIAQYRAYNLKKANSIRNETFLGALKKEEQIKKLDGEFEEILEEAIPNLRQFNSRIQGFLEKIELNRSINS